MILGIDCGNARVKVCGPHGCIDFDATIGEYRERNLVNSHGSDDMVVEYLGQKFFAGSLAACESEYAGTLMGVSKAHTEARLRCLLGVVRYEVNEPIHLVVGQPISSHTEAEKASIKKLLSGSHEIKVNGVCHKITIPKVRIAPEGAAAIFSAPPSCHRGRWYLLDSGSATVNGAAVVDCRYVDKDSWTLPFGLHSSKSLDRGAMADGIARTALKKWPKNSRILMVGGGAEELITHMQKHFPLAEILRPTMMGNQLHPIYSNAIGFYRIASVLYA